MKAFLFLDINKPVQNSIFVFLVLFLTYMIFFHRKFEKEHAEKKYLLPLMVIVSCILIYYTFKMVQYHFS